jgi:hypothetical protein
MLSVALSFFIHCYVECLYAECRYAECCGTLADFIGEQKVKFFITFLYHRCPNKFDNAADLQKSKENKTSGLYYKTITIVIMTIVVTLQIVVSLTIIIDDTS